MRFREPTAWQRYKPQIIAGAAFGSVQALIVFALLASLVKRRRSERSLRESEGRFRLMANAAPVMIWSTGPDKRCTNVNRAFLDFTGRPIEAVLGDGWEEAVHPDDLGRCLDIYTRAFDRREPFRVDTASAVTTVSTDGSSPPAYRDLPRMTSLATSDPRWT